ncbi:Phospholipase C [Catenulispora acidiphila DSM 44928]|uniref:phospholipase C n=1 Tax=Catenulispora acidiphila (strain DSM 44928 / JCM 14897 / NBRC 102108 / NRRL B-24433 / ID139908) TaxID=479433 RepID=C7QF55_CATAD|nr:alkaline phosphatase family protein [Catenulispora acidiphila]ACU74813.1 Phospholipase C [Catenulispora acidiphila DSM 44928]
MSLTRRRLLTTTAAATSALSLPASLTKAMAAAAPDLRLHSLDQIEHVMILMQENRSFDHYYGTMSGVRGFDDREAIRLPDGRPVFYQPDPANPDGYTLPFRVDTTKTSGAKYPSTDHGWHAQHTSWNGGAMDGWMAAHRATDGGPWSMGYLTKQDLPFHYALADAFTICDNYHCSVFGPTHPNRLFAISGTNDPDGAAGGPVVSNANPAPFRWTTYAERLEAAGISWRYYVPNTAGSDLGWFQQFQQAPQDSSLWINGMQPRPPQAIADDIANGDLPAVSWLNSQYMPSIGLPEASEHPPGLPGAGANYIWDVLDALGQHPQVWAKTLLIITYDENDGLFDHVPPPTAPPGTPGEWITVDPLPAECQGIAGPAGLGFRVPTLVISPWSAGGYVCSELFDHTSTLRFLERRFGVWEPNISQWRRHTVGDMTRTLRMSRPDTSFPKLPDAAALYQQELTEVATLPAPVPPTAQRMPRQDPGHRRRVG